MFFIEVQGGYSAYADPIARRAIAVSSDQQHDTSSHPNHPIHPSRLRSNIQRRIRDPSQRTEIIAHYNSDAICSWKQKRGWEPMVNNSVPNAPSLVEQHVTSFAPSHSPQYLSSVPALPQTQHCHDLLIEPLEQIVRWDRSHDYSHVNDALYDITVQTNNNSRRRDVWNEPSYAGIPQFQHNRKVTPNLSSPINSFNAPPSGYVQHLPFTHHQSPTQSQILPFDNFISPSERLNSKDSHFGSMHDGLHFDEVDFFHQTGIPLKKSSHLTYEDPSQRHLYTSNHGMLPFGGYRIFPAHDSSSMAPSGYHDIQEFIGFSETFALNPTLNYKPVDYGDPTVQYSENTFATESKNAPVLPAFRNHLKPRHNTTCLEVTSTRNRFQTQHEHPVSLTNTSRDNDATIDINLAVPANTSTAMGTSCHSFGLLPESRSTMPSSPDHLKCPIVRNPQPFTVLNQIQFFNEGIEVDLNNRPLSRQNLNVDKLCKVDSANSPQHNDIDSNDDFDLVGKTSLWGEK